MLEGFIHGLNLFQSLTLLYQIQIVMTNFQGIVRGKCPKCKTGDIFADKGSILLFRAPVMHTHCSGCGYRFEKEPGYFIGSLYISYALAVAEMLVLFLGIYFFLSINTILWILLAALILLSFFNFRNARTIWIYIFQY